ncbi:MAG: BamA/TamA family outer membrane protein [Candidatus Cloacimonetes bacterium]|nr:BamA/TamA family outer membrane protein [Candidatus Cloacimonadota bacterium]
MKFNHIERVLIIIAIILLMSSTFTDLFSQAEDIRVRKVEFIGNDHLSSGHLRSLMEVRSKTFLENFMIWKKAPHYEAGLLDGDLLRIQRNYQRAGFLNIKIEEPVLIYNAPETKVTIRLILDEGERVRVRNINFRFPESPSENFAEEKIIALKKALQLKEQSPFTDAVFREDIKTVSNYFDRLGYPFIKVAHDLFLTESEQEVDITYLVDPGPKAYLAEIRFTGLDKISEHLLTRIINIKTGDEYSQRRLEQTRSRLQSLGVFQFVSVNLRLDTVRENVPVEITVRENDTITLNFGIGYEVEIEEIDKYSDLIQERRFRYFTEVNRLRFLGGLRKGTLLVKRSYLEPIHINFRLYQPAFPTTLSNVILNPFYRQEREPGYRIERIGGNTTLNYWVSQRTSTYLTYTYEDNNLIESAEIIEIRGNRELNNDHILEAFFHTTGFSFMENNEPHFSDFMDRNLLETPRYYRKSSITWGILRDSSRPVFYPRNGSLVSNSITLSGIGFGSDFRFVRIVTDGRMYRGLSSDLVLALRLKGGAIKGLAEGEYIPIEDRLYAGGSYSVRGWTRSDLGPKSPEGQPLGGKSLLEGSIELRYPLWKQLSVVGFYDFGNVWEDTFDHDFQDLRYAAGGGLRFATPVGPFRLDIGTPIGEGSKPVQVFISIGQAF